MHKKTITEIFKRFEQENPSPKTELNYQSPFELLVAVILSAQATDVGVNKATEPLFKKANTPESLVALGEAGLKGYIKTINLYPTKARHILKTCEILINDFNSTVPSTRKALESLPGVGRKTANVILNSIFEQPTIAVDTHIFRVSNRIGLATGKTPAIIEEKLLQIIPKRFLKNAHHWLVLHGRYVCTAKKPQCERCVIRDLCHQKK